MKQVILLFALMISTSVAYGQLKVDAQGDIGMGIDNPVKKLEVNGDTRIYGSQVDVGFNKSTTGTVAMNIGGGRTVAGPAQLDLVSDLAYPNYGFRFGRATSGATTLTHRGDKAFKFVAQDVDAEIFFQTDNTLRMKITSPGDVGIGIGNPSALLHVNGDIKHAGSLISSDKRLKNNVNEFSLGLAEVLQMKPYTYQYNGKGGIKSNKLQYGLMAQDVQKIVPQAVETYTYEEYADEDQKVLKSSEEFLAVNGQVVTYLLVNAIQEQQDMIKERDEKINDLEKRFNELQELVSQTLAGGKTTVYETQIELSSYDLAELDQNSPNPFEGTTSISYVIPTRAQQASVVIYDLSGKKMKTVNIEHTGEGVINISATDLPSGTYGYSLVVDGKVFETKKMVMTR